MATSPDEMIVAITATLNAALVAAGGTSLGPALIGRNERERERQPPSIVWDDRPGRIDPPRHGGGNARGTTEGNNPRIHSLDRARYEVVIRHSTRAATRTLFENLLASSHATYPNRQQVAWGDYELVPDATVRAGWAIRAEVEITMALTGEIVPIIEAAAFVGDVVLLPTGEVVDELPTT